MLAATEPTLKPTDAWSPELTARLTYLWTIEGESYGEIAETLSAETGRAFTRNMVVGKAGRLDLAGKGKNLRRGGRRKRGEDPATQRAARSNVEVKSTEPARARPAPPDWPPTRPAPTTGAALHPPGQWPLADMRSIGQCRYACTPDSARSHLFCGEPAPIGPGNPHGSWCDHHRGIVFSQTASLGRPAFLKGVRNLR